MNADPRPRCRPFAHAASAWLCAASLALAACGEQNAAQFLGSAKDYLAKKDDKAAVIQLKSALQKDPSLPEARFLLGRTLLNQGDAVSAEVELKKALDLKYLGTAVVPLLAQALLAQGKGERVIQSYADADAGEPAATAALKTVVAKAYAQRGDTAKAKAAIDDALRAAPDSTQALLVQARMKAGERDFDGALATLDRILAEDAHAYEALQLRGDLFLLVKADPDAALAAHRQAIAQRADWLPSRASIIEILLARKDIAGARAALAQLKSVLPNHPQTRYFEARFAVLDGNVKAAREIVQKLLVVVPDDPTVLLLAGSIELQLGSLTQAEDLAAKALTRAPQSLDARRLLAQVQLRAGQPLKARETLVSVVDRPGASVALLNLAGQASLLAGDLATAESYFGRAAKLDPKDAGSRTALALAELSKGRADSGFAQLEEIAASDKDGTIADMALISTRLRRRDYDAALKALDGLERKQPKKPYAAELRGQISLARGDAAAARQSFARALDLDPLYVPAAASLASLDLRDNKPDDARKRFDRVLAADPKNLEALLAVIDLRARAGAGREELAGLLANAIKLNPSEATPRVLLIELALRHKDPKTALSVAQDAVAAIANNVELLDALGRAQLAAGEASQAIVTFNRLAALQPGAPAPLLRLADAQRGAKNEKAAREALQRALDSSPRYLPAQRGLIVLELAAGRHEQALALARKVQRERPDQGEGYLFAGEIEAQRKNWDGAAAAYREGLKRTGSTELALKLHSALLAAKKRGDADAFAATWTKEHPRDVGFRTYLGDRALGQLDYAGAEAQYRAVVDLEPDNPIGLNNLAWVTNRLKKPGALPMAEKANALLPNHPAFLDTLATILADNGQAAKAAAIEKQAVALAPDHPPFRLNLARIYVLTGEKSLAKTELDRLAALGDAFARQAEVDALRKAL